MIGHAYNRKPTLQEPWSTTRCKKYKFSSSRSVHQCTWRHQLRQVCYVVVKRIITVSSGLLCWSDNISSTVNTWHNYGTPTNISGLTPRRCSLRLVECPQLLVGHFPGATPLSLVMVPLNLSGPAWTFWLPNIQHLLSALFTNRYIGFFGHGSAAPLSSSASTLLTLNSGFD